jgi:hypothetical protein
VISGGLVWSAPFDIGQSQPVAPGRTVACKITRKNRVYVGLGDGVVLDDYERAGGAAQKILHLVKSSLCATAPKNRQRSLPPSLSKALAVGRSISLEEVRFEDDALALAHVLLRMHSGDLAENPVELAWRVHVHHHADAWQIDAVRDEPLEKAPTP